MSWVTQSSVVDVAPSASFPSGRFSNLPRSGEGSAEEAAGGRVLGLGTGTHHGPSRREWDEDPSLMVSHTAPSPWLQDPEPFQCEADTSLPQTADDFHDPEVDHAGTETI